MWRLFVFGPQELVREVRFFPWLSLTTLVSTGVSVGLLVALLSIAWSLVLSGLPFMEASRLVEVGRARTTTERYVGLSSIDYLDLAVGTPVFSHIGAWRIGRPGLVLNANSVEPVTVGYATPSLFPTLNVAALAGRLMTEADATGRAPLVFASESWWRAQSAPRVGTAINLEGEFMEIAGIVPREIEALAPVDIWRAFQPSETDRRRNLLQVIGRLTPGATPARAQTVVQTRFSTRDAERADDDTGLLSVAAVRTMSRVDRRTAATVSLLSAAVFLVLLLAQINNGTLQMAHAVPRYGDDRVRFCCGASILQVAMEKWSVGITHGLAGGMLAIPVTLGIVAVAEPVIHGSYPTAGPPLGTAGETGLSVGLGALAGMLSRTGAVITAARNIAAMRSQGTRAMTHFAMRYGLPAVLTAVAVPAVYLAALLAQSVAALSSTERGFQTAQVWTTKLKVPSSARSMDDAAEQIRLYRSILERVSEIPGVSAAGGINSMPFTGPRYSTAYRLPNASEWANERVQVRFVLPGYFEALRIPLREGGDFTTRDDQTAPGLVIDRAFATQALDVPGEMLHQALERQLEISLLEGLPLKVQGVVGDVRQSERSPAVPTVYLSLLQVTSTGELDLVVRGTTAADSLPTRLRTVMRESSGRVHVDEVRPLENVIGSTTAGIRLASSSVTVAAGVLVWLAFVGVVGLLAQVIASRRTEYALRCALGASETRIIGRVLFEAIRVVAVGTTLGIIVTHWAAAVLDGVVFGVPMIDVPTFTATITVMIVVGLLAALQPALAVTGREPAYILKTLVGFWAHAPRPGC